LKALTQNDEKLLFGRADVVCETVGNCRAQRLTVLTSEPGVGVTSLLQAGVAPALWRDGFAVAIFSDWQGRLFASRLKQAIADTAREQTGPPSLAQSEPLHQWIENTRARTGKPVAILLDQFEDYLRCHSNTVTSDSFDAEIAQIIASRQAVLVIGLQVHAVPALERLKQNIPNLLGFQIALPLLGVETAREVVLSEVAAASLAVEPAALNALCVAPMTAPEEGKVHPFFLKVASGVLMEAEVGLKSPVLRAATIEARGGVDRMVLESLDAAIAELGSAQGDLLYRLCSGLISPEKVRLSITEKGLAWYAGRLNRLVPRLLERLTGSGVLRSVEIQEATRYELSRECLAPILRDWWERREASIVIRRRVIFQIMSISVAIAAITLAYIVWLVLDSTK
jgi:hypothetical protein